MPEGPLFFLIAGEASGDLLGARLMRALTKLTQGKARFTGIGGPRMRAEGLALYFPQEELAHFGLFELARHIPNIMRRLEATIERVKLLHPTALITIDAPDFCFRVAKRLKGEGFPLIHYVAPTVWAWRPGRARKIAAFLDHLLALLPFEPPYFTREGLPCTFVGHPIVESGAADGNATRFRIKHLIASEAPLLTVLPGSRMSEVSRLMPIFRTTVQSLYKKHPGLRVVMPVTPNVCDYIKAQAKDWPMPVFIIEGDEDKYDAFAASKAALACSGTISFEIAMARLPAVIAYQISPPTAFLYRRLVKVKYASLINLMQNRMIVPEFIQQNCTPEKLSPAVNELLTDEAARARQIAGLADVASWLGAGQFVPSERAAQTVLDAVGKIKPDAPARSYTVLQVIPALVTGGVERGTVEVTAALVAAGHRAIVASSGGPMVREIEDAGGVHVELPLATKNPLALYRNIRRLAGTIKRYKVDIVHARSRAPAWSAKAAAARTGAHFITTFHNAYGVKSKFKRVYNSVMARGERVIAISDFVGDHAASVYGVPRKKLRVIPRGVDIRRFDPASVASERIAALRSEWQLPQNAHVVMLPGRLTRWKGHLVFLEALRLLGRSDVIGVIVGGGSRRFQKEIKEASKHHGLDARIRIVDNCRDMPAVYRLADIIISASTRPEGFGRVIAEAQAMGRPVIATDHGGARETVIEGETGFLVPPSDAEALSRAIANVLALTPEARAALAQRSIAHIRTQFTTDLMTSRTLAVYEELKDS